ncbi:MAG: hypothetical protein GY776_02210 [Alteromonas sp.]|nr:hypothetical protein [Alteromonas sp.]
MLLLQAPIKERCAEDPHDLIHLLAGLHQPQVILPILTRDFLSNALSTAKRFKEVMTPLDTQRREILYTVMAPYLAELIHFTADLKEVIAVLTSDQRKAIYQAIKDGMVGLVQTIEEAPDCLRFVTTYGDETKVAFCQKLHARWHDLIDTKKQLQTALQITPREVHPQILSAIHAKLPRLIHSMRDLSELYPLLETTHQSELCAAKKNDLSRMMKSTDDLLLLSRLPEDARRSILPSTEQFPTLLSPIVDSCNDVRVLKVTARRLEAPSLKGPFDELIKPKVRRHQLRRASQVSLGVATVVSLPVGSASIATLLGATPATLWKLGFLITMCQAIPVTGQGALLAACALISLAGLSYFGYQGYRYRSQLFPCLARNFEEEGLQTPFREASSFSLA